MRGATGHAHSRHTGGRNFNPRSPCGERPRADYASAWGIDISIHAPLAGSDCTASRWSMICPLFQSTLPLRGATPDTLTTSTPVFISIHAPLAGSDDDRARKAEENLRISIHAPLAGSDRRSCRSTVRRSYFNPRSPCGERLTELVPIIRRQLFQSTLPLRGAT